MNSIQIVTESTPHLSYISSHASINTAAAACCLAIFYFFVFGQRVATNATWHALTEDALKNPSKARAQWVANAHEIVYGRMRKIKGSIAVFSSTGPTVVVPNSLAHEIRNMKELHFGRGLIENFLGHHQGLTPFLAIDHHEIAQEVIRLNLTRSLDHITEDMNAEVEAALMDMLGDVPELKHLIQRLVARVSTRVFLGEELSNNAEWLDIALSYVENSMKAIHRLSSFHPLMRPIAQWWIPELGVCRQQVRKSRELINPLVLERLRKKANGAMTEKTADMISWIDDKAKAKGVKVDFAELQLLLAHAALHTTTEMVSGLMCDLLENENWIPRLREEMVSSLSQQGWKKTSLASMKLLDSAMKESQRFLRMTDLGMNRLALTDVTLSDGTIIPKGYKVSVEHRLDDPTLYPNAEMFEADRFLKLRETDQSKWHFVTGSPEHLSFGYGKHTCPGRFFASHEIKIAMVHLLIKYDWKFTEEGRLENVSIGSEYSFNQRQKVMVKRLERSPRNLDNRYSYLDIFIKYKKKLYIILLVIKIIVKIIIKLTNNFKFILVGGGGLGNRKLYRLKVVSKVR
ncbi:cytochrome P450 [Periconia macrospinosa]|uniref:Cytochrome P450 n=1 Tax=Periconia macrospinosa TaxID=97972 RepID=A0A2V1DS95_9PLEO|nr:cytochrome P450 [Periconia macrospinosa]